jgi:RNA-directed DNA polymerase
MGILKEMPNDSRTSTWNRIDWQAVTRQVCALQARLVKAVKKEQWGSVRSLQRLLIQSMAAKLLAVRQVTSNHGKRTAGVDGILWNTPEAKYAAAQALSPRGYHAKPLRRVWIPKHDGTRRPLGIPTMRDRAMQALYRLALDPIAECQADPHSYGFRKGRSVSDAIAQCFTVLSHKGSAQWVLEGDIKRCFDNISHDWLITHIPLESPVLHEWLRAGVIEDGVWSTTLEGTPQGGIISPTLCNMVLDGIQQRLEDHFSHQGTAIQRTVKIHFVRYADDFIITGRTKAILEEEVKPLLEAFLAERGLNLSPSKTQITHIDEGFEFLGFHLQKSQNKLIIRPSKASVNALLRHIRHLIHSHKAVTARTLIDILNPVIRGWAQVYRHVVSSKTFQYIDGQIWESLWKWARRRHRQQSRTWIAEKYFMKVKGRRWLFSDGQGRTLFRMKDVPIRRHCKVKSAYNPYDSTWEHYRETRRERRLTDLVQGTRQVKLWLKQDGQCPYCRGILDGDMDTCGWSTFQMHHVVPLSRGGTDALNNLRLLHDVCHRQLHACHEEDRLPVAA